MIVDDSSGELEVADELVITESESKIIVTNPFIVLKGKTSSTYDSNEDDCYAGKSSWFYCFICAFTNSFFLIEFSALAQIDNNAATATIRSLVNNGSGSLHLSMDHSIPSCELLIDEENNNTESLLIADTNNQTL